MARIPIAEAKIEKSSIAPSNLRELKDKKVSFSFEVVENNEYFNLDGTCQNWAADLFCTMQKVSKIPISEITSGRYSGKTSPLRIHTHEDAMLPCPLPNNVSKEDMWQIRISRSKGGIHGIFHENLFFVIWFDPQHNLYPDKNHGGLKKVTPPSTCCKDRDIELSELREENERLKGEAEFYQKYAEETDSVNAIKSRLGNE